MGFGMGGGGPGTNLEETKDDCTLAPHPHQLYAWVPLVAKDIWASRSI